MNPIFLSARELSQKYFRGMISYQAVLKLTREGLLPAIRQGKSYIYEKEAVETCQPRIEDVVVLIEKPEKKYANHIEDKRGDISRVT